VWAIKRCPQPASPCSGCRADVGDRPSTLRVAPGALRERLTFRRWRVDRPLDGGLARRPELCVKFQNGTTQNRRRRCTVERPSEAATGSSRRTSTGFAGTRLAARSRSGSLASRPGRAKPGGTLLTPTSAEHPADPSSIPSKGMPPARGPSPTAVPELLPSPKRISRSRWSPTRCPGSLPGRKDHRRRDGAR
jgi:hypothetical protein